ncbi:hypothetical protein BDQ12DRAFT_366647 [Crucibulum laeve]|uniref:Uncharacterized protein n=1 Tax=Crucibulum laeve TaxID=68775 RepID=A0A5C3M0B9_9AGAR|nr:hypothetical protein BDQ12DRAFT_366647 [Crucibulum laeve]
MKTVDSETKRLARRYLFGFTALGLDCGNSLRSPKRMKGLYANLVLSCTIALQMFCFVSQYHSEQDILLVGNNTRSITQSLVVSAAMLALVCKAGRLYCRRIDTASYAIFMD